MASPSLIAAFRRLQLPIASDHEVGAIGALEASYAAVGVEREEIADYLCLDIACWLEDGLQQPRLMSAVACALAEDPRVSALGPDYFDMARKLTTAHGLNLQEAQRVLSHAGVLLDLAGVGRASASQLNRVLRTLDPELRGSWQAVRDILRVTSLEPKVAPHDVEQILEYDEALLPENFVDAGVADANAYLAERAASLGFPYDLEPLVDQLADEEHKAPFFPYVMILHWQALTVALFDHPPSWLYEFAPRGNAAETLFALYRKHVPTGNPVLNNAKSVARLDRNWSSTKTDRLQKAHALVDILTGLDQMGYLARKDLCDLIRQWCLRIAELYREDIEPLPSPALVDSQLNATEISSTPTGTWGILEQRFAEALGTILHPDEEGWAQRGIGDPINASNLSRKKLGDCEFLSVHDKRIVAYEPTAGRMSQAYLVEHQRSLARVLEVRRPDLLAIAEEQDWNIAICVLAHEFASETDIQTQISGFPVTYTFKRFEQFAQEAPDISQLASLMHGLLDPLRLPRSVFIKWRTLLDQFQ